MFRKLFCLLSFFLVAPATLAVSLYLLVLANQAEIKMPIFVKQTDLEAETYKMFAAVPQVLGVYEAQVKPADGRTVHLENFLRKYNSSLRPYEGIAQILVNEAEKCGIEYNLDKIMLAIGMCESGLKEKNMPPDCYNAWGWGIHSRGTLCFPDWETGIQKVALGICEKYLKRGMTTPEDIMRIYTPLSNGSWAHCFRQFYQELE